MERTQLTKGARAALDRIADELGALRLYAQEARDNAKRNPILSQDASADVIDCALRIAVILKEEIEPLLERRAGSKEDATARRLDQLEAQVQQLRDRLDQPTESSPIRLVK